VAEENGGDLLDQIFNKGEQIAKNVSNQVEMGITNWISSEIVGAIRGGTQGGPESPPQPQPPPAQGSYGAPPGGVYQKQPSGRSIEGMRENLNWSFGGTGGATTPLTLSAATDCYNQSDLLTVINPGEFFVLKCRVLKVDVGGNYSHTLMILSVDEEDSESGWVFRFRSGTDEIESYSLRLNNEFQDEDYPTSSYLADKINTLVLTYDGKYLCLVMNDDVIQQCIVTSGGSRGIKIRAVGMDASFWG
jgi:hypothetical protein